MTLAHDAETEKQWSDALGSLFLCELRVVRRLVNARYRALAGSLRPSDERCRCPYCWSHPEDPGGA